MARPILSCAAEPIRVHVELCTLEISQKAKGTNVTYSI